MEILQELTGQLLVVFLELCGGIISLTLFAANVNTYTC
jgi:hypothetical protein